MAAVHLGGAGGVRQVAVGPLDQGAQEAWSLISRANQYVEETAPWNLAKSKDPRLNSVLGSLTRTLSRVTVLIQPFIPAKAEIVWRALGYQKPVADARWDTLETPSSEGKSVTKLTPLFPKPDISSVTA